MKYKALIFDMDGTLVDTEHHHYDVYRRLCDRVDYPLTEEEFCAGWMENGTGTKGIYQKIDKNLNQDNFQVEKRDLFIETMPDGFELLPGVMEALEFGKANGFKMAIATGSQRPEVERVLAATGIADFFDVTVSRTEAAHGKPAPDIFLKAVELLGVDKEDCLVIENAEIGLNSAIAADIPCIVVPSWLTKKSNFDGALKLLDNMSQLIDEIQ